MGRGGLAVPGHLGAQLFDHVLGLQIPDLDAGSGGGAQPVAIGREAQAVDGVGVIQGVQMLAIIQVPKHGLGVLAAGGAQGTIGRHGHRVQIAGVADVVGLELAVGQVPHLKAQEESNG